MPPLPAIPRWLSAALFAAALGAAFWRIPPVGAPAFAPPPAVNAGRLPALYAAQMLPMAGAVAAAPSLAQLPDGRIAAAWVAGSDDTADDLAIHFSILGRDGWSDPRPIANRESTAGGLFAHVRRVGQPQLYAEGSWLHLWYAAVGIGGSANVALVHSVSTDAGRSWSKPARLPVSPLAGFGTTPAGPPLALADGGIGLPLQHELFASHGEWLRLSADGRSMDKVRLAHPRSAPQPAVLALDPQRAVALLRDAGAPPGQVRAVHSADGGQSWQAAPDPGPANPGTPLAVLRLPGGRLLLAGNPASGREMLALWLSADEGASWQAGPTVEAAADGAADFSAPALLLGRDGRIHLAYVWRGQGIRHVVFSEAWLDGGGP
ncbi:MAG TPA: exo-alpha-sialidase [Azonexus sp.]